MNQLREFLIVCICVAVVLIAGGASRREVVQPNRTSQRLFDQLNTDDRLSYLQVGETFGTIAQTDSERLLASQTLAIGIGLAVRHNETQLAASMAISLASIETNATMASALWDLAVSIDPLRYQAWLLHRDERAQELFAINRDAARALYAARFADPKLATELLGSQEVRQAIRTAAQIANIDPQQVNDTMNRMISEATDDECRGRIFIPKRGDDGQMRRIVCQDHTRPVGVALSDESLQWLIKLELILLNQTSSIADSENWEVGTYLKLDAPVRDPSAAMIVQHYRVDLAKPYRKGDRWVSTR